MDLKKSAVILSLVNSVSILLGIIFHIQLARSFGASLELDSYFIALLVYGFGSLTQGIFLTMMIPIYLEMKDESDDRANRFVDTVLKYSLGYSFLLFLVIWGFAEEIVKVYALGFGEEQTRTATEFLRTISLGILFQGGMQWGSIMLNANYNFLAPALGSLLTPALNLIFLIVLFPGIGLQPVLYALPISTALQLGGFLFLLWKQGQWWITGAYFDPRLAALIKTSFVANVGSSLRYVQEYIVKNIASFFPSGSITQLGYAIRILEMISQVLRIPIVRVVYIRFSDLLGKGMAMELRMLMLKVLKLNIFLGFAVSVFLVLFLRPTLEGFLGGSAITTKQIIEIYFLTLVLLPGFLATSYSIPIIEFFYAERNSLNLLKLSAFELIVFCLGVFPSVYFFEIYGLSIAISGAFGGSACMSGFYIAQAMKLNKKEKWIFFLKTGFFWLAVLLAGILVIPENFFAGRGLWLGSVGAWIGSTLVGIRLVFPNEWNGAVLLFHRQLRSS